MVLTTLDFYGFIWIFCNYSKNTGSNCKNHKKHWISLDFTFFLSSARPLFYYIHDSHYIEKNWKFLDKLKTTQDKNEIITKLH